jgi:ribose 1,5-bisphosphokinase PhnN
MLISVVGPSRSGKSTVIAKVRPEFPTFIFLDLEAEEERAVTSFSAKGENPAAGTGAGVETWRS